MPFTLSHTALVLPLRRWLPLDALVIGSMAPDFEYMVRLEPTGFYAHNFPWFLWLTTPVAALVLLGWRRFLRNRIRIRLGLPEGREPGPGPARELLALLVGILGHLLCDACTHRSSDGLAALGSHALGPLPIYKVLQYGVSLLGLGVWVICLLRWTRRHSYAQILWDRSWRALSWIACSAFLVGGLNALRAEAFRVQVGLFATGCLVGAALALVGFALWPVGRIRSPGCT